MPAPYLTPQADAQRNNISSALMNIARPPPQMQMPQMPPPGSPPVGAPLPQGMSSGGGLPTGAPLPQSPAMNVPPMTPPQGTPSSSMTLGVLPQTPGASMPSPQGAPQPAMFQSTSSLGGRLT